MSLIVTLLTGHRLIRKGDVLSIHASPYRKGEVIDEANAVHYGLEAHLITATERLTPLREGSPGFTHWAVYPEDATGADIPTPPRSVADLDGTDDAADWVAEGYPLSKEDVAWIRSLLLP